MQSAQPVAASAVTRTFAQRTRKGKHNFYPSLSGVKMKGRFNTNCKIIFTPMPVFSVLPKKSEH